ncbi:hypothetical protein FBX97_2655 [Herbaspirillum sp. SJZ107]|nr:hypothetical protein FBX97_2655 [Herbaspirillum sp. SJZ107]
MGHARDTLVTKENLTEGSEQEGFWQEPDRKETNNDDNLMQVQNFNIQESGNKDQLYILNKAWPF